MNESQKSGDYVIDGRKVHVPNTIVEGDGFYISYNAESERIYGVKDTTAIVAEGADALETRFYVLNGDHRESLYEMMPSGLSVCLDYFKSKGCKNFYSDVLEE